jgi:membrane-bound lytic murein transglycosylase B
MPCRPSVRPIPTPPARAALALALLVAAGSVAFAQDGTPLAPVVPLPASGVTRVPLRSDAANPQAAPAAATETRATPAGAPASATRATSAGTAASATRAPRPASAGSAVAGAKTASGSKTKTTKKSKKSSTAPRDDDAPDSFLYGRRPDVVAFAALVADERGIDGAWVEAQLARARYQPGVAKLIMPPPAGVAKNWKAYRARFLDPQRLRAGVAWWQAHADDLARAEERFGVPPEIVAAIAGVETYWGRLTGNFRVLDALATLAFDFPPGRSDRSAFYRDELRAYLTWCALEDRDADTVRGSYAGAIGWPQFMPSSILKYAIDFDGNGRVDLAEGGADVIGSIANFLATAGWQRGAPTHFDVVPPADPVARAQLLAPDIVPTFSAADMIALGAELPAAARAWPGPLALVQLENGGEAPSFIAGTANFYVVTRYNWSAYYALAVIDLAGALKRELGFEAAARIAMPVPPSN